ncbi:MAG: FKBP-type peptidyl-prolyl cis-trans isomerase [Gemmatimonadota bacterium]
MNPIFRTPFRGGSLIPLLLTAALLGACADAPEDAGIAVGTPEDVTYAPELNVDLSAMERTAEGLYYLDLEEGSGPEATSGQMATVHYTGSLPSGEEFDSSRGRAPFQFALGAGEVIRGWDQGVAGMRVGGQRLLVIPPELAYGQAGAGGVIPPGATLVFEVELLALN